MSEYNKKYVHEKKQSRREITKHTNMCQGKNYSNSLDEGIYKK